MSVHKLLASNIIKKAFKNDTFSQNWTTFLQLFIFLEEFDSRSYWNSIDAYFPSALLDNDFDFDNNNMILICYSDGNHTNTRILQAQSFFLFFFCSFSFSIKFTTTNLKTNGNEKSSRRSKQHNTWVTQPELFAMSIWKLSLQSILRKGKWESAMEKYVCVASVSTVQFPNLEKYS